MKKPIHKYRRVLLLSAIGIAGIITITGCKSKENNIIVDNIITPILTTDGQVTPTPSPTPIAVTPAPGLTVEPSQEATPKPTEQPYTMSQQEAEQVLHSVIDTQKYTSELIEDNLNIDGKLYYRYVIMEQGIAMEPSLLVEKETGTLYCYDSDGNLTTFTKFPLDNVVNVDSNDDDITQETAYNLLKKLTSSQLGLVNDLSKYSIIVDDWTTVVPGGDICYCFNVFEGDAGEQLVGMYYVSVSGKNIYRLDDDLGEIVLIK